MISFYAVLIPIGTRIEKRPLIHPAIPSPYAGSNAEKVVYFGTKTPFMSAFKRVKKLLSRVEKRQLQSDFAQQRKSRGRHIPPPTPQALPTEPVVVKATGRAIDRALQLALFLQKQEDLRIEIKTGSIAAIDDIVENDDAEQDQEQQEQPESRMRHTSVVEISASLTH